MVVGRAQGAALALFSIVTTFWSDFSVGFFWSDNDDTDEVMELVVPPPPLDGARVVAGLASELSSG